MFDPFGNAQFVAGAGVWNTSTWNGFTWGADLSLSNLRFPGQYADAETALNQNWFRDYDPTIGRYTKSDPIGVMASVNTYDYVENPLGFVDRYGLCRVDVRFSKIGPGYYHAYLVTTEPNGSQTFFRGGPTPGVAGPSSGNSGALASASGGSASGWSGSPIVSGWFGGQSNTVIQSGGAGNASSPGSSAGGPGMNIGPWGPIVTESGAYVPGTTDYETGNVPSVTILNNSEPCTCMNQNFGQTLQKIQKAQIPHNPLSTNSNATASNMIQQGGLPLPTPPVWAPGWSTSLHY